MNRCTSALPSIPLFARRGALLSTVAAMTALAVQAAPSASADAPQTFGDLQTAFANGGTVQLHNDITETSGGYLTVTPNKAVTLDLDGHALSISKVGPYTAAIVVSTGAQLTVEDSVSGGSLMATAGGYGAGIGGSYAKPTNGSVTLAGGSVTATGGAGAAGIGGGYRGGGGSVTVSGGTVNATGGGNAAGVGSGFGSGYGSVDVSGGSLTATGGPLNGTGSGGSGIGGASQQVTIDSGGSVTAVAGASGVSAIGNGATSEASSFGSLSNAGSLTIPSGATLAIPSGVAVPNSGTINLGGALNGAGTVTNTGKIVTKTLGGTIDGHGKGADNGLLVATHNYDLSFDTQGASSDTPADQYVYAKSVSDSAQSLPSAPTHGSDTFTGWFTAATGGTQVTDTSDLSALLNAGPTAATLFAQYRAPAVFTAATPQRLLDTRSGIGAPKAKLGPDGTLVVTVPDLPSGTKAVALNLTAVNLTGANSTFVSACPAATSTADCVKSSALNVSGSGPVSNQAIVPVASDGTVRLVNHAGSIDLVADLGSYLTAGYTAIGPNRVYDSRQTGGPIGPNTSRVIRVPGVPAGTTSVVVTLTATGLTKAASTYLSACPAVQPQADCAKTSTLNVAGPASVANTVTVPVGADGSIRVYNQAGSVNVVLDVAGYLSNGFAATGPTRAFDTRSGSGIPEGRIGPGKSVVVTLQNLPAGTVAVSLNLTATGLAGAKSTFVTACAPADSNANCAAVSTINVPVAGPVAHGVIVPVDSQGRFRLYNHSGSIDMVGDLTGTFTA